MDSFLYDLGGSALYKFIGVGFSLIVMLPILLRVRINRILGFYAVAMPFTIYLTGNTFFNFSIVVGLFILTSRYCSKKGKNVVVDSVAFFGILFCASFLPSILISPSSLIFTQLAYWLRIVSGVIFYIVIINSIDSEEKLFNYTWAVMMLILFYAAAAVVELIWFPYQHQTMGWRLRGPFREYELFSEFLAMIFPLSLYMIGSSKEFGRFKRNTLLLFFAVVSIVCLILTGTRGGPVAMTAGLMMFLLLSRGRRLSYLAKFTIIMLFVVPISVSSFSMLKAHTRLSEVDMDLFSRFEQIQLQTAISGERGTLWGYHIERMTKYGYWVLGEGPGHPAQWLYNKAGGSQKSYTKPRLPDGLSNNIIVFPHNLYITLLETGGVCALATFIFLVIALFVKLMKTRNMLYLLGSRNAQYINMLIAILFIFIIDEIKIEFVRYHTYILFVFGSVFGLMGASAQVFKSENNSH